MFIVSSYSIPTRLVLIDRITKRGRQGTAVRANDVSELWYDRTVQNLLEKNEGKLKKFFYASFLEMMSV